MKLEEITYFIEGKKKKILVKRVSPFSSGLMFRKKSFPLLFSWPIERTFSIFSLFCNPFRAIWLDENMKATSFVDVKTWRWNIRGKGKYLLEIPFEPFLEKENSSKMINSRRKKNITQ